MQKTVVRGGSCRCSCPMALTYAPFLGRHANWFRLVSRLVVCAKYLVQQLSRKYTEKTHGLPQAGPAPVQPYPGALILRQSEQQRGKNANQMRKQNRKKRNFKKRADCNKFWPTSRLDGLDLGLRPIKIGCKCVFDLLWGVVSRGLWVN